MLDGYIENFCYCTPYDYRNLFWKICLSLYKKKKGAVAVSIVYITIMLVLYMIPPRIDNFPHDWERRHHRKYFFSFSIRWLTVAMAARLDDLVTKALFRNMSAEKVWLQYGLYVGTRVLILCFVSFSLQLQSV